MIGNIIKLNGQELLVLDYFNNNPFVICLNTGIQTIFNDKKNTDYCASLLRIRMKKWAKDTDLGNYAIPRNIDLTAMDGGNQYHYLENETVAPLTFDEYHKYRYIIKPHIKKSFWTCTSWGENNWASCNVCSIHANGSAVRGSYYDTVHGLAPAFILNKQLFVKDMSLFAYTTEELLQEITRRTKGQTWGRYPKHDLKCLPQSFVKH